MSLIREALAHVQGFLIEPAPAEATRDPEDPLAPEHREGTELLDGEIARRRQVPSLDVVVLGLSGGCGVTTLARGLAASLSIPGERPAQLLIAGETETTSPSERVKGTVPTWRLPPRLSDPAAVADHGEMVARLAGRPSALVWDVAAGEAGTVEVVAARADAVVLVAGRECTPALAEIVRSMVRQRYRRVVLAANRITDSSRWNGRCDVCVPESRLGAMLIARGWRPGSAMGGALAKLAALVEPEV